MYVTNKTKSDIIGIAELKLEHPVPDLKVYDPRYVILSCDASRNRGGVVYYIGKDLCFNILIASRCREIENIVFDILLPKS